MDIRFKESVGNSNKKNISRNKQIANTGTRPRNQSYNRNSVKLSKRVTNNRELNIREAIGMLKNENNRLNWALCPLRNSLQKPLSSYQ